MKVAGLSAASIRTRVAAGWRRSWRASKSRPRGPAMTISPSTTAAVRERGAQRVEQLGEVAL